MSNLKIFMGLVERYLTILLSLTLFILIMIYDKSFQFILKSNYLDKVITISSALFAFLLTILTIIVQSNSESILRIKAHQGYKRFILFNRRIVFLLLFTTIISVIINFTQHILKYINNTVLFISGAMNTSLFFLAALDAIYFTLLFYSLMMLETKDKK